jgi:hypothetical protein
MNITIGQRFRLSLPNAQRVINQWLNCSCSTHKRYILSEHEKTAASKVMESTTVQRGVHRPIFVMNPIFDSALFQPSSPSHSWSNSQAITEPFIDGFSNHPRRGIEAYSYFSSYYSEPLAWLLGRGVITIDSWIINIHIDPFLKDVDTSLLHAESTECSTEIMLTECVNGVDVAWRGLSPLPVTYPLRHHWLIPWWDSSIDTSIHRLNYL